MLVILGIFVLFVKCAVAACPSSCQSCDSGQVRCTGAGLRSVPTSIPNDTQTVDLSQNDIETLASLPPLPNAQSLRLPLNKLREIKAENFVPVPQLMGLDLSINSIRKVHKHGLKGLNHLKSISLNGNQLAEIGHIFIHTPALTQVQLGNNEIERIEKDNFKMNTMIKMLDLSNNKLISIHGDAFKTMYMLRYLILSNNPLTTLPDLTFTSTMLSLADFSNCELTSVPHKMPPSLVDFRLGYNKITNIYREDFENITSLSLLTLNDNKIATVEHRAFESLDNLQELWLSRNDMVYIPRGLPNNLKQLYMDNNQVVELEPMLFNEEAKLKALQLENNNILKVHQDALKNIQELELLNLQGNDITLIDAGTFSHTPLLRTLTLDNNPIQLFETEAFANLNNLTEISLSYIESKSMPEQPTVKEIFFNSMPNVTRIDMMSSRDLVKEFLHLLKQSDQTRLLNVKYLNLQYNELITIPEAIKDAFPNVNQLLLDGNLLQCDRNLLWLHTWMQNTNVSFHQYEMPMCNSPESVRGRIIYELNEDDFLDIETITTETAPSQEEARPRADDNFDAVNSGNLVSSTSHNELASTTMAPTSNNPLPSNSNNTESRGQPTNNEQPSQTSDTRDSSSKYSLSGTRVIIKPPSNKVKPSTHTSKPAGREHTNERKADRDRKRRDKKEENLEKNKNAKEISNAKVNKTKDGKKCNMGQNGKKGCEKKKRCNTDDKGNVICRKNGDGKKPKRTVKKHLPKILKMFN